MKSGFLNTDKARRKFPLVTDAPICNCLDNDKGMVKAETSADAIKPCPPLLDLHSVTPSMKSLMKCPEGKNRFIFRHWPRDPNGKHILPSQIHGKQAGNGLDLWGATLYDFYFVRRIPSIEGAATVSTGSKLTKVMESFGELEHAKSEIAWATRESDPKEIPAWDPALAIVAYERRVHADSGVVEKGAKTESTTSEVSGGEPRVDVQMPDVFEPVTSQAIEPYTDGVTKSSAKSALDNTPNEPSGQTADSSLRDGVDLCQLTSRIPVESPFHPSHYPSPWPLPPFESPYSPFPLQRRIPIHLLPKKLYVHDPWKLVHADPNMCREGAEESWTSKADHIHTYTLSLPPEFQTMVEPGSKATAAAEDEAVNIPETVFIPPQEMEGPTQEPAIRAFLPKRPRKPTEVSEAHLYLSPKGRLGTGNHSIVYEAELELPRDIFCDSTYCKSCLDEQIKIEVDKMKESGVWRQRLNEAANTYKGPGNLNAASNHSPSSSSVQIPPRYVGFVKVRLERVPVETVDVAVATTLGETSLADAPFQQFARVSDPVINRYIEYEGPVAPVHLNVQWQNPSFPETLCKHRAKKQKPVPWTSRFRVAAKLSFPEDPHLDREANNYSKFPAHFFQHWTGYNVVPPLVDPTPVGALVPQFFGYYTPDTPSDSDGDNVYRSPILLIEHCGKPISVDKLTIDDRHECAALLFRFHAAGWRHESFAERNILMQKRHPTCSPLEEGGKCDFPHQHRRYSFRLIDFGRSVEYKHPSTRSLEENMGKELFGIL